MREIVDAVKTAVPDAANRPAGAVLEHVLSALKASDAKIAIREGMSPAEAAAEAVKRGHMASLLERAIDCPHCGPGAKRTRRLNLP